jgi:hypothetical protein
MKRVTDGWGNDLRKRSAQRARCIRQAARIDSQLCLIGRGEMAQLVIHSTLLRHQQQQQKTQCFEHVSHSAQRLGNLVVTRNATRIGIVLQLRGLGATRRGRNEARAHRGEQFCCWTSGLAPR